MNGWSQDMAMPSMAVIEASERTFMQRVFGWMAGGLALTGLVSWWVSTQEGLVKGLFGGGGGMILVFVAYIGLAIGLQVAAAKAKAGLAAALFVLFSAVTGLMLAPIFLVYTHASIANAFFVTAGTFGACALYGALTKVDLTKFGGICTMLLIGVIIASLVNLFLRSPGLYWITTYIAIFVFVGLTAWDVQKLKAYHRNGIEGVAADRAMGISGALMLYLDFINLFVLLVSVLGRRRD